MKQAEAPLDRIELMWLERIEFDPPQTIPEKLRRMRELATYARYFYARYVYNDIRNSLFPMNTVTYVFRARECMCN